MRLNSSTFRFSSSTSSTTLLPLVPDVIAHAIEHFVPQGVTIETLHPVVREACIEVADRQRTQTGESRKQARRRGHAQASELKRLGLERQLQFLFLLGGSHGVNLGMIVTGAMYGLKLEQIRFMVALGGEPARA